MRSDLVGKVIRRHMLSVGTPPGANPTNFSAAANFHDVGLIVHTSEEGVWYILLPAKRRKKSTTLQSKLSNPRFESHVALNKSLSSGEYSIVNFSVPTSWKYSQSEVESLAKDQAEFAHSRIRSAISGKLRRINFKKWLEVFKENRRKVEPILEAYSMDALLEQKLLATAVTQRAQEINCNRQTLHNLALIRMMGCRTWNSLMPRWNDVGGSGAERFNVSKLAGAKPRLEARGVASYERFDMDEHSRMKCRRGYIAFKRPKVTDRDVYRRTMVEFWPGEHETEGPTGKEYKILPLGERPSYSQFLHCIKTDKRQTTFNNWINEKLNSAAYKKRVAKIRYAGQLGEIDATSEDQTPVSEQSRLKVLSSTWRAVYIEVKTGYILGFYSGFESPCTLTNLLAILHGATEKQAYLERYGKSFPWLHMLCKTISADNGEMKSEQGIFAMEELGVSIVFARAWTAEDKTTVEVGHKQAHLGVDHRLAGSTEGKRRERGEKSRDEASCRRHRENIIDFLGFVDKHNNHQPVPHLVPDEMVADGEEGVTRHAIMTWLIKKGYVASEPDDIESLRKRCLPRFPAQLTDKEVRIYNPLQETALIPNLRFSGPIVERIWKGKSKPVEALMDPTDLNRCFLVVEGKMFELARKEANPLELALFEHIQLQETLKDNVAVQERLHDEFEANRTMQIADSNRIAKAEKKKEAAAAANRAGEGSQSQTPAKPTGKRMNTTEERESYALMRKGLDPSSSRPDQGKQEEDANSENSASEAEIEAMRQRMAFMLQ